MLENLKRLRTYAPGFLIVGYFSLPILFIRDGYGIPNMMPVIKYAGSAGIALFIGLIYYSSGLRDVVVRPQMTTIQKNIKDRLFSFLPPSDQTPENRNVLYKDRYLMGVFYKTIDGDKTLTIKSTIVMQNGAALTLVADVALIGFFGSMWTFVVAIFMGTSGLYAVAIIELILSFTLLAFFLPKIVNTHLELSNEQLDLIEGEYSSGIRAKLLERLKTTKSGAA